MELKLYQTGTLCVLRRFFEEARIGGPKNAYEAGDARTETGPGGWAATAGCTGR